MTSANAPVFDPPLATPPAPRTYWVLPGFFLAGAYPGAPEPAAHAARLRAIFDAGCRTVVSLMEEDETNNAGEPFAPYAEAFAALAEESGERVELVRFAIPDVGVTTQERMTATLAALDAALDAGRGVYLHCFGGMGRTGTAVCCWLLRHGHASGADVFEKLSALRQADQERRDRPAPETQEQRNFVRAFAAGL